MREKERDQKSAGEGPGSSRTGEDQVPVCREETSFQKIYRVVQQIPAGRVASYGQVAALAGNGRWARVVGYALHANGDPDRVPCYRVVTKEGYPSRAFAFGGENEQVRRLKEDGIEFQDGHVVMEKYQWETPWI